MAEPPASHRRSRWLAATLLALAAILHLLAKWPIVTHDHGIYWPDEIYESLEMAHRAVFGYGLLPWEFVDGARNWAFPLLLTLPLRAATAAGLTSPLGYLLLVRLCLVGLTLMTAWWIARGARERGASDVAASLAGAAFLLCGTTLYFSHRALSDNVVQLPTLVGLVLLSRLPAMRVDDERRARTIVLAATALGVATLLRLQLGLVCATAVAWLFARVVRRRAPASDLAWLLATLSTWAVAYGALDAWTYGQLPATRWGGWFHSAIVYWRFNAVQSGAGFWGTAPIYYFPLVSLRALEGLAIVLIAGALMAVRRLPLIALVVAVFVGLHSLVPHKEFRFILPIVPLVFLAAAVGLSSLRTRPWRRTALVALAASALFSFAQHRALTMRDIGAYPERRNDAAFDDFGAVNRLLLVARDRADLCGIRVDVPLAWAGGMTYLHRPVPMYGAGMPVPANAVNYEIGHRSEGSLVASDGDVSLRQLSMLPCVADAGYEWRLR